MTLQMLFSVSSHNFSSIEYTSYTCSSCKVSLHFYDMFNNQSCQGDNICIVSSLYNMIFVNNIDCLTILLLLHPTSQIPTFPKCVFLESKETFLPITLSLEPKAEPIMASFVVNL